MVGGLLEAELQKLAMANGAQAMDSFVGALDEALPTVMQHEPSMAAGIAFARRIAMGMAQEFRKAGGA